MFLHTTNFFRLLLWAGLFMAAHNSGPHWGGMGGGHTEHPGRERERGQLTLEGPPSLATLIKAS
jgi:hypothetical protein